MTRAREFASGLVPGVLVALSMPPWGWWPLTFVGLALLTSRETAATSRAARFRIGMGFGCGWFLPAMSWMWFLTAPGFLIAVLLFAALHGLASLAAAGGPDDPWSAVRSPAAHMLVESLRLFFPFGGVPLATVAIAQVSGPLHRIAAVGGVVLLSWVAWQVSALLSGVARRAHTPGRLRRVAWTACAAVFVFAFFAPSGRSTGRTLHVVAVQGGGPQGTRAVDTDPREVVQRHLDATAAFLPDPDDPVDVVVWPENVVDVVDFESSTEHAEITAEADRIGAPFAVGITEDVGTDSFTNAQVVVEPSGGVTSRYDKVRRVPFGEYMPLRSLLDSIGAPVDLVPRDAVAGTDPAFVDFATDSGPVRAGVVISWEVFFGGRARDGVGHGGEFIMNPTNGSSYTWTVLQTQQIASSRLRAIESGRWVVQVSPTGFSAFVSPDGDVIDRTSVSEASVIDHRIELRGGRTPYGALGDKPFVIAVLVVLLWAVRSSRCSVRR